MLEDSGTKKCFLSFQKNHVQETVHGVHVQWSCTRPVHTGAASQHPRGAGPARQPSLPQTSAAPSSPHCILFLGFWLDLMPLPCPPVRRWFVILVV